MELAAQTGQRSLNLIFRPRGEFRGFLQLVFELTDCTLQRLQVVVGCRRRVRGGVGVDGVSSGGTTYDAPRVSRGGARSDGIRARGAGGGRWFLVRQMPLLGLAGETFKNASILGFDAAGTWVFSVALELGGQLAGS